MLTVCLVLVECADDGDANEDDDDNDYHDNAYHDHDDYDDNNDDRSVELLMTMMSAMTKAEGERNGRDLCSMREKSFLVGVAQQVVFL